MRNSCDRSRTGVSTDDSGPEQTCVLAWPISEDGTASRWYSPAVGSKIQVNPPLVPVAVVTGRPTVTCDHLPKRFDVPPLTSFDSCHPLTAEKEPP